MAQQDFDPYSLLDALRAGEDVDLIRASVELVLQQLIEAEATAAIGAAPHERSDERLNWRNGHRPRVLSTKAGDIDLQIPKLRSGSFFPENLERRRRVDRALFAVVMEAYVHGVSTRKVDDLARALGVASGISVDAAVIPQLFVHGIPHRAPTAVLLDGVSFRAGYRQFLLRPEAPVASTGSSQRRILGDSGLPATVRRDSARQRTEPPRRTDFRVGEEAFDPGDDDLSAGRAGKALALERTRSVTHLSGLALQGSRALTALR